MGDPAGSSEDADSARVVVVTAGHVLTMGAQGDLVDGAVAFDSTSGLIMDVGPSSAVLAKYPVAEVSGGTVDIVTPGFINAHDHLSEGLISGMGESMSLFEWAERLIRPVAACHTRETARIGTQLKGAEMLLSGITCVNDMFVHTNPGSGASLGVVDGLAAIGLRGVVSFGAEDIPDPMPIDVVLAEHADLSEAAAGSSRVSFRLGIGTILGQSDQLFAASVELAREKGWAVHTHLAEVREEITASRLRFGKNTLAWSLEQGLLDADVIFAHCNWMNEQDVETLRAHGATVVHNPVSNMILASGVCPVPRLRSAGIPVALGTDGAASNDSHDMMQVMKCAALLQKLEHLDAMALSARDVMTMATIEGARALKLDRDIGSIEPGKRADLIRFSGAGVRLAYIHDPYQQLVYGASPQEVADVWVDGRRVVSGGRLCEIDEASIVAEAREAATEMASAAHLEGFSVLAGRTLDMSTSSMGGRS